MAKIQFLVEVEWKETGEIRSTHRPLSESDRQEMASWPSGGLVQISHALFLEALRRESYTMALSQLSAGTPPEELTASGIEVLTRAHLLEMADNFAKEASEGALKMILLGAPA